AAAAVFPRAHAADPDRQAEPRSALVPSDVRLLEGAAGMSDTHLAPGQVSADPALLTAPPAPPPRRPILAWEPSTAIAMMVVASFCLAIFALMFRPVGAAVDSDAFKILLGALTLSVSGIVSYYFGASRPSASDTAVRKIATGEVPGPTKP